MSVIESSSSPMHHAEGGDDWAASPFSVSDPEPASIVATPATGAEIRTSTTAQARSVPVAAVTVNDDVELGETGKLARLSVPEATSVEATPMGSPTIATSIRHSPFAAQNSVSDLFAQIQMHNQDFIPSGGERTQNEKKMGPCILACIIMFLILLVLGIMTGHIIFFLLLADKIQHGSDRSWRLIFIPICIDFGLYVMFSTFNLLRFIFSWNEVRTSLAGTENAQTVGIDEFMDMSCCDALRSFCSSIGYLTFFIMLPVYLDGSSNFGIFDTFLPIWIGALSGVCVAFLFRSARCSLSVVWLINFCLKSIGDLAQVYLIFRKVTGLSNYSWAVTFILLWIGYGMLALVGCCMCSSLTAYLCSGKANETLRGLGIGPIVAALGGVLLCGVLICPLVFFIFLEQYLDAGQHNKDRERSMLQTVTPLIVSNCMMMLLVLMVCSQSVIMLLMKRRS